MLMIQSASVFGLWGIAFLLAFVPASVALSLRRRKFLPAVLGIAVFASNAAFGALALQAPNGKPMRIALIDSDALDGAAYADDGYVALAAIDAYGKEAMKLAYDHAQLVIFPEKLAIIEPPWRAEAQAKLAATAKAMHATLVAGFDNRNGADAREHRMGLSGRRRRAAGRGQAASGSGTRTMPSRPAPRRLRFPAISASKCAKTWISTARFAAIPPRMPAIIAVPAWDFGADGISHGRMAIMRGVENGFAVARTARGGLLSLSDPQGRTTALRRTYRDVFTTLESDVAVGRDAGDTIYDRIGDAFAWLCIAVSASLLAAAFQARRRKTLGVYSAAIETGVASWRPPFRLIR